MQLLTTKHFNGYALDCYVEPSNEDKGDFWATREQIGHLLEYAYPRESIGKIHERNKERLDRFSAVVNLTTPSGVQPTTIYNFKGLLEICRYSQQPNANAVMDWLFDVADEIRRTGSYTTRTSVENSLGVPQGVMEAAKFVFEAAQIKDNQLALALDKVAKHYTGQSMLALSGVSLIASTNRQLLTPTQIGKYFNVSGQKINTLLLNEGYQRKVGKTYEPLELGEPFAVMQDVGRPHSDGTPIRQLKWDSSILDEISDLLDALPFTL